ncbi:hypothetical protein AB0D10_25565 [Kitasatospora sp. NPDC048545]|uniref:hypothetical protein n=1 Tax=Kitasatospora sp. NPDC048545 TaxID=3157208 RepID=UPI0033EE1228
MNVHELVTVLPDPGVLRARCRALALLDIVLDGFAPRHGYVPGWRAGVDLATMDNGSSVSRQAHTGYSLALPAGSLLRSVHHQALSAGTQAGL